MPATSGSEGVLAFAIARAIIDAGLRPAARLGAAAAVFDRWRATPEAEPEAVAAATGISAARIERLARAFVDQSPSVAIVGGAPLTLSNGLFTALAVNALNTLNGSVGTPGGLYFTPQVRLGPSAAADPALSGAGGPLDAAQLLFLDGVNPVHLQSAEVNVAEALAKVPMIVSFGQFLDETSAYADLILPDHSFLEQWTDAIPESGSLGAVITVAPPVMAPLYQTRATTDLLLEIGRRLATPVDLGWQTFEEMLAATFATLPPATEGGDAWAEAQEQGGWWGTLPAGLTVAPAAQSAPGPGVDPGASAAQLDGDASQYPLQLIAYPSSMFLDGSLAHLPWMQETPDPITSAMWSSWIEINPATAQKMGVATGDLVDVASAHASLRTAAVITPGIAPGVVAMPMGQGHTMFTRVATGRGENPARLLSGRAWAATRVTVSRAGDPDGRLILFAGGDRDHDGAHEYGHAGRG